MATNNADWIQTLIPPRKVSEFKSFLGIQTHTPPYSTVEFLKALDEKLNVFPVEKILLHLNDVILDITSKYEGGALIELVKELAPDQITAGDMQLSFANDDNTFSELNSTSDLYDKIYHNKKIQFFAGFQLPDGSKEYTLQATMLVTGIEFSSNDSKVILSCEDIGKRFLDETINRKPSTMVATAGASNVGNGTVSDIAIKPFSTVAENWTLTCTLAGGDATATFSVVGSVSGNIGTATSGTEFKTGNKVKFTISGGGTNWALDDVFTFSTIQMMEFNSVNPIKIIWSILTGYNWDTAAQEAWYARTPQYDATKSVNNPDIDLQSFQIAIVNSTFNLKGYVGWDVSLTETLQNIILHFLGSIYINEAGQIAVTWFKPSFGVPNVRLFSDSKKIFSFLYRRKMEDMINYAACRYKKLDTWDWEDVDFVYDGFYVNSNATSITNYKRMAQDYTSRWYSAGGDHVEYFIDRLIDKYSSPPFITEFETGADAFLTKIGDKIYVTDTKANISGQLCEITRLQKDFATRPRINRISAVFEQEAQWGYLGSSANEGDGFSAQALDYDDASNSDKQFAYASTPGANSTNTYPMTITYTGKAIPASSTPAWAIVNQPSPPTLDIETVTNGSLTLQITTVDNNTHFYYYKMGVGSDWESNIGTGLGAEIGFIGKFTNMNATNYFEIRARTNGYEIVLRLYASTLNIQATYDLSNDSTKWQYYRLKMKMDGTVELYIDDVLIATGIKIEYLAGIELNWGFLSVTQAITGLKMEVEKFWYKTPSGVNLAVPGYRMW